LNVLSISVIIKWYHISLPKEVDAMDIILGTIEKAHEVLAALVGLGIALLTFITVAKVVINSIKGK